jgi:predicted permease
MRREIRLPFTRRRLTRDVDDEIAFHIATRVDRLVASGLDPEAARREALKQFGDVETVRQGMLDMSQQREIAARRSSLSSEVRQDLVYGLRMLRRDAVFTLLVIGGLALGIGANATIFSLIDAMLLRKLPVAHPNELVAVGDPGLVTSSGVSTPTGRSFSYPLYKDVRDNNGVFTGVFATGPVDRIDVRVERAVAEPEHPRGRFVSGNYFSVLGLRAVVGGTLDARDDVEGAPIRATIGYNYWTTRFQSDPGVVGRVITINGQAATITGVAPAGFTGEVVGSATDVWIPVAAHDVLRPNDKKLSRRRAIWLLLVGRAKPELTLDQVKQRLIPVIESSIMTNATATERIRLAEGIEYDVSSAARGLSAIRETFGPPLLALMVGVALLLGIVCVNVANLLLARGIARRREMALRLAIGANRARVVRQLLTESMVLALGSGAAALLVAWWGSRALLALASEGKAVTLDVGPTPTVLAFTFALSIVSVVIFGLVPALRSSRVSLSSALRAQSRSVAHGARFGIGLIAAQVAVSLVLVTGASMLTRSLRTMQATPLGLDRDRLVIADLDITSRGDSTDRLATVVGALRDRVRSIPGVTGVTMSNNGLFSGTEWHTELGVPGFVPRVHDDSSVAYDMVGAEYAKTLGAHLIAGRDFSASDEGVTPRSAIVNESFARFYLAGRNPIGETIRLEDSAHVEIVGVVADIRGQALEAPAGRDARRVFVPYLHRSLPGDYGQPGNLRLIMRTVGDPNALAQRVRQEISATDPSLPIDGVQPLSALVRVSIREERMVAQISTALGVLALLLAGIGLYGVTSYSVARRTGEIGVRVALGARATDVVRMVVRDVLRPVTLGVVLGLPFAFFAMRLLQQHLAGATSHPASVLIGILVLVASAGVAGVAPAMRAARIDPLVALRSD